MYIYKFTSLPSTWSTALYTPHAVVKLHQSSKTLLIWVLNEHSEKGLSADNAGGHGMAEHHTE